MKTIALLFGMALAFAASNALAQGQGDACSPHYGSCMDRCTSRPKAVQESCAQMCEANTNQCYQGLYGSAPRDGQAASAAASPQPEARDARDEAKASDRLKAPRK